MCTVNWKEWDRKLSGATEGNHGRRRFELGGPYVVRVIRSRMRWAEYVALPGRDENCVNNFDLKAKRE
jgi:hypothetical protein